MEHSVDMIRAKLGDGELLCQLAEELADVSLCLKCLGITTDDPATALKLLQVQNQKAERWAKRLEGK